MMVVEVKENATGLPYLLNISNITNGHYRRPPISEWRYPVEIYSKGKLSFAVWFDSLPFDYLQPELNPDYKAVISNS